MPMFFPFFHMTVNIIIIIFLFLQIVHNIHDKKCTSINMHNVKENVLNNTILASVVL
jgi:hypothetical protein